ncbi:MAG: AbrB/MazE/SpoVT family DNA-binding domain-containing protein [Spirochaetales bacterium]|jgi:antitoxin MazE|nr:AbrB/MazE/SpoVT family DNA-binding domain-containing protein [Spirochaetales bacterium]MBE7439155.1 AbrB/MazE/SpoVT family DNA-binding domain-containing protein [Spirochaetales bacterium]
MKASVVRIGNSRGIRIPQPILEACGIEEEVNLRVQKRRIVLEAIKAKPRAGWGEQLKQMRESGEDTLFLPPEIDSEFQDWKW